MPKPGRALGKPYVEGVTFLRQVDCPRCGAPLSEEALVSSVATCGYCDGTLSADPRVVWAGKFRRSFSVDPVGELVQVADTPYVVEGRIAEGESTDVFLARRARLPVERVVLKVLRARGDEDLLLREWSTLDALHASDAPGASHFVERLPSPVCNGLVGHVRASVFRYASGFAHTLEDVRASEGDAIDARHAIWILRRTLELLSFVHASGFVHGAVVPRHLVVHARDHGVMLVGWSCATREGERFPLRQEPAFDVGQQARASVDVASAARSIAWLCGGDAVRPPATLPTPLASLIRTTARVGGDAATVERELVHIARALYGPPTYVRLAL